MQIKVMIDDGGYMPEKAHESDAGFDLMTPCEFTINGRDSAIVKTKVHMMIPDGYVGFLKSKSGLNVKQNILSEGVIDAGYNGEIVAKLYNNGDVPVCIRKGSKITQIVIIPIPSVELVQSDVLEDSERGSNGFGSSGE